MADPSQPRALACMSCGADLEPPTPPGEGPILCPSCGQAHAHERPPRTPADGGYAQGQRVLAEWAGCWWQGEIVEVLGGDRWRVRFIGWGAGYDRELGPERLRSVGGVSVRRQTWVLIGAAVLLAVLGGVGLLIFVPGASDEAPDAVPVTADTPLELGQSVEVRAEGRWSAATVVGVSADGRVRVRVIGVGEAGGDLDVERGRLRLPGG